MVGVSFARLYTFIYDYGIDKERMWSYGKFKKTKKDELVGKMKETVGDATGNDKLKLKGKAQKNVR
ncbi:CsbD family protein [Lentilactobacillus kisonensis]|uniref:CsbD family protein n=1 Tax=Lentilactobacillus kisonensis TaxID=481722 RepID=UPI000A8614DE|nr:CsbD family protein [Lentilactobacillus kisonensis]